MAGVASALVVLVTILKLGPLFQELPKVLLLYNLSSLLTDLVLDIFCVMYQNFLFDLFSLTSLF